MTLAPGRAPSLLTTTVPAVLPRDWCVLRTPPAAGSWNMACDLTLLELARTQHTGFLRVYGWSEPTVSFGRNERTAGVYSASALVASGLAAVRRPTGGRALLHHREVTYSVAIPMHDDVRWQQAYRAINEILLRALEGMGVPANIVETRTPSNAERQRSAADASVTLESSAGEVCFSGMASGELAVAGRKLVASSVWRERGAYLQHGSILIVDDQRLLMQALGPNIDAPEPAAVLSEWMTTSVAETADLVEIALRKSISECGNVRPWSIPADIVPAIDATGGRLAQVNWLWRR